MSDKAEQNKATINAFYTAFSKLDGEAMGKHYAESVVFSDAIFSNLNFKEVTSMWTMLTSRAKEFKVKFSEVTATETEGSALWEADYLFQGNKVHNVVNATFKFDEEGKITEHIDSFDFKAWARQALGFAGKLLGGFDFFKTKVQKGAKEGLDIYIAKSEA
eukprot:snap_masked-scaffold_19-processed-gene-5.18-mRNA-1 protein AED:1.00 eAED:1.00 QI:0/-1/0/0/-1/1/1/0/160